MTGWRIGYTASNSELANIMGNIQSHTASNPNSIAQHAFVAALNESQDCINEMWNAFEERRSYMLERFDQMKSVSYLKPDGAFYLFVNIADTFKKKFNGRLIADGNGFADQLLEHALVAVVPGEGFGAPEFMRLSYATSMDKIKTGLDRIENFLNQLQG
jgi:aspartate aminotransferase